MSTSSTDNFFQELDARIESIKELQATIPAIATATREDANYSKFDEILSDIIHACGILKAKLRGDEELHITTRKKFQEKIRPYMSAGWLGRRMFEKPRGYAGDYQTLIGVYDQGPQETGFGGFTDLWIMDRILSRAIRSRWQEMRKFLTREISARGGHVSILDIASGPCREFAKPLEVPADCHVMLQCLDNDRESLDFVRDNVVHASGISDFRLDQYNALRLKNSRVTKEAFGTFDIVYSIGLFDYIDDTRLVDILAGVKDLVNDSGVIYLNFKDTEQYDEIECQWLLDWHFFQRTEQDCLALFAQAGYDLEKMEPTTRDDTKVIINFVNRPSMVTTRIDAPTSIPKPKQRTRTRTESPAEDA